MSKEDQIARINARRSLFLKKSLLKGTVITKDHLISKRPLSGISPENIEDVLGKKLKKEVKEEKGLRPTKTIFATLSDLPRDVRPPRVFGCESVLHFENDWRPPKANLATL